MRSLLRFCREEEEGRIESPHSEGILICDVWERVAQPSGAAPEQHGDRHRRNDEAGPPRLLTSADFEGHEHRLGRARRMTVDLGRALPDCERRAHSF